MKLVDTHAHLDLLKEDVEKALGAAAQAGVTEVITIGISIESSRKALQLARRYPQVYATVGIHPHDASLLDDAALKELRAMASDPRVVGIGETGLDFYRNLSPPQEQERAFRALVELAKELDLPVVVHDREAHSDTMNILKEYAPFDGRLIMHCFSGDLAMAQAVIDMEGYISVAGPVTFLNARKLPEIVKEIPLDKLLLETDCPFLSPHPYRGKPNSPWRVRVIAEKVAELKGIPLEELRLPNPFHPL
jgi:TatD DNase family protein